MKTINKKTIDEVLNSGGYVRQEEFGYDTKYILLDNNKNKIGVIRFNTYLKLNLIRIKELQTYHYTYYKLMKEEENV